MIWFDAVISYLICVFVVCVIKGIILIFRMYDVMR